MAYVGYTGVANLANTSQGTATGAVATNYLYAGEYVGDHGVVDLYGPPAPPSPSYYVLMESTGYVLMEDGSKVLLEA